MWRRSASALDSWTAQQRRYISSFQSGRPAVEFLAPSCTAALFPKYRFTVAPSRARPQMNSFAFMSEWLESAKGFEVCLSARHFGGLVSRRAATSPMLFLVAVTIPVVLHKQDGIPTTSSQGCVVRVSANVGKRAFPVIIDLSWRPA